MNSPLSRWTLAILVSLLINWSLAQDECHQHNFCSNCLSANPKCAWCAQLPSLPFSSSYRCDTRDALVQHGCQPQYIEQSTSDMIVTEERDLGTVKEDLAYVTQLKPQQLTIALNPGESIPFPLEYEHIGETGDVYALNSKLEDHGVTIRYQVLCKGQTQNTNICPQVEAGERVTFTVNISFAQNGCELKEDGMVVAVGVAGVRETLRILFTPNCQCPCTKLQNQQQRSNYCAGKGTLVCGQCICEEGFGGPLCQERGIFPTQSRPPPPTAAPTTTTEAPAIEPEPTETTESETEEPVVTDGSESEPEPTEEMELSGDASAESSNSTLVDDSGALGITQSSVNVFAGCVVYCLASMLLLR